MRILTHPSRDGLQIDTVLAALADPVRLMIVKQLANADAAQACVSFDLPVSKSTSTHHFRVLREAGLIEQQYCGTSINSTLRREDLDRRFPGLLQAVLNAS
ncbi:ArsR/SmtB family transcription factor [Arthrobacter cavernae]|uniref:Helix-turn-helix transcriptional regulator n=1 Tax=Arthrobacter cavernae TaxID=2817681 RepID=A0A939HD15_9MICC|nr:helix-turn-helix transcriptional regulator [Arthrobacter cavernae]MBO1268614.1 helix-turn-helix transcriptional regulator [Arthrobacter cavernae]